MSVSKKTKLTLAGLGLTAVLATAGVTGYYYGYYLPHQLQEAKQSATTQLKTLDSLNSDELAKFTKDFQACKDRPCVTALSTKAVKLNQQHKAEKQAALTQVNKLIQDSPVLDTIKTVYFDRAKQAKDITAITKVKTDFTQAVDVINQVNALGELSEEEKHTFIVSLDKRLDFSAVVSEAQQRNQANLEARQAREAEATRQATAANRNQGYTPTRGGSGYRAPATPGYRAPAPASPNPRISDHPVGYVPFTGDPSMSPCLADVSAAGCKM